MPSQKLDIKWPADIRMFLAERQKLGQMGAVQPTAACIQCIISECLIMVSHQHRLAHMHQLEIQTPPGRHTVRWLAQYRRQQHHVTTKHQLNAKLYQDRMHQTPQHARLPRLLSTPLSALKTNTAQLDALFPKWMCQQKVPLQLQFATCSDLMPCSQKLIDSRVTNMRQISTDVCNTSEKLIGSRSVKCGKSAPMYATCLKADQGP
jgi:hypothetical protein